MESIAQQKNTAYISDAFFCSAACIVFAWFIHDPFPTQMIAFASLVITAFLISRHLHISSISFRKIGKNFFTTRMMLFSLLGLEMGIAAALYYRNSYGLFIIPNTVTGFVFIASGIAITEELVFRGFIQGQLQQFNPVLAIIFGALSHAAYKSVLFLSPFMEQQIHVASLFYMSFLAFLALGILKHYSKSILPPVFAHVIFDILVYAEMAKAPWWVW